MNHNSDCKSFELPFIHQAGSVHYNTRISYEKDIQALRLILYTNPECKEAITKFALGITRAYNERDTETYLCWIAYFNWFVNHYSEYSLRGLSQGEDQ